MITLDEPKGLVNNLASSFAASSLFGSSGLATLDRSAIQVSCCRGQRTSWWGFKESAAEWMSDSITFITIEMVTVGFIIIAAF